MWSLLLFYVGIDGYVDSRISCSDSHRINASNRSINGVADSTVVTETRIGRVGQSAPLQ